MSLGSKRALAIASVGVLAAAGIIILFAQSAPLNTARILRLTQSASAPQILPADDRTAWTTTSNNTVLVEFINNHKVPVQLRSAAAVQAGPSSEAYWAQGPVRIWMNGYLLDTTDSSGVTIPPRSTMTISVALFETSEKPWRLSFLHVNEQPSWIVKLRRLVRRKDSSWTHTQFVEWDAFTHNKP